jgi:hypothetical protein
MEQWTLFIVRCVFDRGLYASGETCYFPKRYFYDKAETMSNAQYDIRLMKQALYQIFT